MPGFAPVLVFLIAITFVPGAGAQVLLGVTGNGSSDPGKVFSVNDADGQLTFMADVSDSGLSGMAVLANGTIYVSTIAGRGTTSLLLQLDPETGTRLSTVGQINAAGAGLISIGDLAVQPGTDALYGVRSNADGQRGGGEIYTIDTGTGDATLVGAVGDSTGGGIAFTPDGSLWKTTNSGGLSAVNRLLRIDPATAAILDTTITGLPEFYDGLGSRPDGILFATGPASIHRIDPIAGSDTPLSPGPVLNLSDLAFDSGTTSARLATWGRIKHAYRFTYSGP